MSDAPAIAKVHRGFLGSVLALSTGAVTAQALNILGAPLISRLFSPETIGVSILFMSIGMVLWVISCARYDVALMLPREDERAANVLLLALSIPVLLSGILCAIIPFARGAALFQEGRWGLLAPYLWLLPLFVCAGGWVLALRAWHARHNRFGRLGMSRVSASAAYGGGAVLGGLLGMVTPGVLVVSRVFQPLAELMVLGVEFLRRDLAFVRVHGTRRGMAEEARHYRKFPGVETFTTFLSASAAELPVLLLGLYFAKDVLGFYGYAVLVLLMPMRFAGEAIRDVFFQRSSAQWSEGESIGPLVESVLHRLMGLALAPMGLVALAGPAYFAVVFGEPWAQSGVFARLLAPFLFFLVLTAPLSNLFSTLQRQGSALLYTILSLGTRGVALAYGGAVLASPEGAVWLYSLVGAAGNAILLLLFLRWTGARLIQVLRNFLLNAVAAAPTLLLVAAAMHWLRPGPMALTILSALSLALVPAMLWVLDREFRELLPRLLRRGAHS